MTSTARRLLVALTLPVLILTACSSQSQQGWQKAGKGFVNLLLSPIMIAAGIAEGIAFLPYTADADVKELDRALVQAKAVSLNESYKATFGIPLTHPDIDPKSGDILRRESLYGVFRPDALFEGQRAFEKLLVSQGMPEEKARHYILVGNFAHAWSRNLILLAVVYRHPGAQPIQVRSKSTNLVATLRPWHHQAWHEAYLRDVNDQVVDEVIDWAAMEYAILRQDKVVATLMVLAVEGVKSGKRAPDYWQAERRWTAGETAPVMQQSTDKVKRALPSG